jgi:4-hydroxymandelate oxidase
MHPAVYDYFAGGAGDESALAGNVAAWRRVRLRPHVLRDVRDVDSSVEVFGDRLAGPVLVAPMGYQRLAHPDGELGTAAGAGATGLGFAVSTYATTSIEEVAAAARPAPVWFQAYVLQDRVLTADLLRRAKHAGCRAVLLTVDAVVAGDRRRDARHGYVLPHDASVRLANLRPHAELSAVYSELLEQALTPELVGWVADTSGLPVLVKGVLRGDDARLCVDAGAAGVVVSNHGGRQLDAVTATADALPEVVDAVGDRATVLVDGGVRSGADVVRALTLGARAVLLGRPVLWALAVGGEEGVRSFLTWLADDVRRCLALCGARRVADLQPDLIARQ